MRVGSQWMAHMASHRRLPWMLGLLAVALTLPALATGFQFDDYRLRTVLRGQGGAQGLAPLPAALNKTFVFMDGDPAHGLAQMASGALPWWALPAGQVAFWRPVAALTHWIDFALWPADPVLMHLHSLLWLGLLVAAAAGLYRQIGSSAAPAAAGLAGLLYAVDPAHGFAASWLSNRNILMAAFFGVLALSAQVRWRREGWRAGALLGPALLLLALLSAEAAVAVLAYWLAYALFLDRHHNGAWRAQLSSLAPAAGITLAWRLVYRAWGYGAWGTSYIDPLREPLPYLRAVIERAPLLLLGQWLLPPAEYTNFFALNAARLTWVAAVLLLALLAWVFRPVLRRSATARFWGAGMLLAVLPACAALPANRLLFLIGLGAMGLLAEFLASGLAPALSAWEVWANNGVTGLLLAVHLIVAPVLLPVMAFSPKLLGGLEHGLDGLMASLPADPRLAQQTAVIIYAPNFADTGYIGLLRPGLGLPSPARVRSLATGLGPVRLTRTDAHSLVVTIAGGTLKGYDSVFRGVDHPLALGQVVDLGDVQATVLALTPDGRPATVTFHFTALLEDPSLRWFRWLAGLYVPSTPPAIGAAIELP
jgi:hypothetical protein